MLKLNEIYCGDCNNIINYIDDESIDLVLFSPPYDKIRSYNGFSIDFDKLGRNLFRVCKNGSICAIIITDSTVGGYKTLTTFKLAVNWVELIGWNLFEHCIYSRSGRPGKWWNNRFRVDHEYILFFLKGDKPKYFNKEHLKIHTKYPGRIWCGTQRKSDGTLESVKNKVVSDKKCRGTIWHYSTSNSEGNKTKLKHPGTFPDRLADDIIRCFSKKGDTILDPTVGSGTTAVLSMNRERNFLGIDISQEYVDIAKERLENEKIVDILM